ncbi:MAG: acyl-CoA/acyl-ACP dehydrogenase [Comamonas sp.]|jgi:alkylation response protein AidB-like acyl-CoA dehydrogenase|uniref:acyl-CoA dehydrogenase family protein n=1 Tax=Comamonas sp. TaxID=34028 RepID=UPI00281BF691|nr:acyl-CoA dehydrogenase family protein [Comamonas sp.]MDR0212905.1 acyl-CoA/acyl-ACP dehydrogenase [Comamonas sp.]
MDLSLNEEQKMIAESAVVFLQEKSTMAQVRKIAENEGGMDRALWRGVVDMGWCGVALPEVAGGMGLGWCELVLLQEQMGYHLACVPFFDAVIALTPLWQALSQTGQGLPVVERLAQSGQVCVLGMTVRGELPATATVKVDGDALVLNGQWNQVGSGAHADVFLLPATLPCGSLALLEVPAKAQGLQVQPLPTVDTTRSSANVTAVDVPLTGAAVLVHGDALRKLWAQTRNLAAIGLAAEQVGVAERALDLAVAYTKERQQFGKAVGSFQGVKHRAAQMLVKVETARSAVYAAAFIADTVGDATDLTYFAAQARTDATEAALFSTRESIQLHGGVGFTWEFDPHLFLRRAQAGSQRMGTVEQWREQIAARLLDESVMEAA